MTVSLIRGLTGRGIAGHLASNQEAYKARHMSEVLGHRELFEREFYSCHMGIRKPNRAYFQAILGDLALPPEQLLFIDDTEANVLAAREVGIRSAVYKMEQGPHAVREIFARLGIPMP